MSTVITDLEPSKRKRGRPPGQQMKVAAQQLRHTHFSFLRGVMQGLDLRKAWSISLVYEGGPDDERHFAARLRELLSVVRLAAGERGLHARAELALAGLDRVAPKPVPTARPGAGASLPAPETDTLVRAAAAIPTLDEWVDQRCADLGIDVDFQSQAEWLAEYEDEFNLNQPVARLPATSIPEPALPSPPPPAATPAGRALDALPPLEKRLEALNQLTYELAKPPALTDALSTWLSADISRRLAGATIEGKTLPLVTLGNLIAFVNLYHHRWWVHVPRLGEKRAGRLMEWLVPLAQLLDHPIKEISRKPLQLLTLEMQEKLKKSREPQRFGVVPLDRLAVPPELDGSHGDFRSDLKSTIGANTDLEAIFAWLRRFEGSPRTRDSYARIAERFYLWCIHIKRKPMSSLVTTDFYDYHAFMAKPPVHWVQERRATRETSEWRPFKGPLSASSIKLNFSVIAAMHTYFLKQGYMRADPSSDVLPSVRLPHLQINIDRSFTDDQWHWVMQCWQIMYEPVGPKRLQEGEVQQLLPDNEHPDISFAKAAALRRTRLTLELGATTGLRLIEFVTTRRGAIRREIIDGQTVWIIDIEGKGKKGRKVLIYDDIKELLDQHNADMVTAGTSYDPNNKNFRKLRNPTAAPTAPPSPADEEPAEYSPVSLPAPVALLPSLPGVEPSGFDRAKQPLLGALKHAVRRKRLNHLGMAEPDLDAPSNADGYGSLDPTALQKALKRFLENCCELAVAMNQPLDTTALRKASMHWMRHFFANSAINDGVEPIAVKEIMGHSSLAVTEVYLRQDRKRLVHGMNTLQRRR